MRWPGEKPPIVERVSVPWLPSPRSDPLPTSASPLTKSWRSAMAIEAKASWDRVSKPASKLATITPSPCRPIWWTGGTSICVSCPAEGP